MGLFAIIMVGLIAGVLATLIMGVQTGVVVMLIVGVVGSFIGNWLSSFLFDIDLVTGINLRSVLVSLAGSIVLIVIYRFLTKKR